MTFEVITLGKKKYCWTAKFQNAIYKFVNTLNFLFKLRNKTIIHIYMFCFKSYSAIYDILIEVLICNHTNLFKTKRNLLKETDIREKAMLDNFNKAFDCKQKDNL